MNPIQRYLEKTGLTRSQFAALMREAGWAPSRSTLSRWISGEREPSAAAKAMMERVTRGGIVYG